MRLQKMNEIELNGKTYIEKSSIKTLTPAKKNKKGLTYCIVRTYIAGVFAGYFDTKTKGNEGTVYNARRLWKWSGAASLSQLSMEGVSKPDECKFPCEVNEVILKEIIEVLPCSKTAQESIASVKVWEE